MRRKLAILCIVLIVIAGAAYGLVEYVLHSDIPRSLVEKSLQDQTGLDVSVGSLSTGWDGITTINDLRIVAPLDTTAMVHVPQLRTSHAGLIKIILQRPLSIASIDIDQPLVHLCQDADGVWNIQRAMDAFMATIAAKDSSGTTASLPALTVTNAIVEIEPYGEDRTTLPPATIAGGPVPGNSWNGTLHLGEVARVDATFSTSGFFPHRVNFDIEDVASLVAPFRHHPELPTQVRGSWRGTLDAGVIAGTLKLDEVISPRGRLSGRMAIRKTDDALFVDFDSVSAELTGSEPVALQLHSGEITLSKSEAKLHNVELVYQGVVARASGSFDRAAESGQATIEIKGPIEALQAHTRSTVNASFYVPAVGTPRAQADIAGEVRFDAGLATVTGRVDLKGALEQAEAVVQLSQFFWDDAAGRVDLSGTALHLARDEDLIRLRRLSLPESLAAGTDASASYDIASRTWDTTIDIRELRLPRFIDAVLNVAIAADGESFEFINIRKADASNDWVTATSNGIIDRAAGRVQLEGRASIADSSLMPHVGVPFRAASLTFVVTGDPVQPLLELAGQLNVETIVVGPAVVDAVAIPLTASMNQSSATFATEPVDIVGGTWQAQGSFDRNTHHTAVALAGMEQSIEALMKLFQLPIDLRGTLSSNVDVTIDAFDLATLDVTGNWQVQNLTAADFTADGGSGRFAMHGSKLEVQDIDIALGDGTLKGWASVDVHDPARIEADLHASKWPVAVQGSDLLTRVDLDVNGVVNVATREGDAAIHFAAELNDSSEEALGAMSIDASLAGSDVVLSNIHGTFLSGEFHGNGQADLHDLLKTTMTFQWESLELASFARFADGLVELEGVSSGHLEIGPAVSRTRNAEPAMQITANGTFSDDAGFRTVRASDFEALATIGASRQILDSLILNVADGSITVWGSSTIHAEAGRRIHLAGRVEDIDLEVLTTLGGPTDKPLTGRVDGTFALGGYVSQPDRMFGKGAFDVRQADLGSLPIFAQLHDLLKLDISLGQNGTGGKARAEYRIEGKSLLIEPFTYFHRGMDAVAQIVIEDVWLGGESPISGFAIGTVRPFRDVNLPLASDLDRLLGAFQSDAASVSISGTLAERLVQPTPLNELGAKVGRMLRSGISK
ncbi:MAG: hypothetical protein ACR2GY_10640 [Phycisphaerales bacterium]